MHVFGKNGLGYILGDFLQTHLVTLGGSEIMGLSVSFFVCSFVRVRVCGCDGDQDINFIPLSLDCRLPLQPAMKHHSNQE
jgi:hypothetical protein